MSDIELYASDRIITRQPPIPIARKAAACGSRHRKLNSQAKLPVCAEEIQEGRIS